MRALISAITGFAVSVFYRRVHLGGEVPPSGPLVVVANHPNALLDPVLVQRVARRGLRLLGKAPLFDMPVIGWLARGLGMLPVYRSQDGFDTSANERTFGAVHAALAAGDAVCLFPEGISHDAPALQPLKTGAARMALGAEDAAGWRLGVRVVPVGLVYRDKATFRSEVATEVGAPIDVADWKAAWEADPREAARDLTATIADAMARVTVNLEAWEDLPLLELARRLLAVPGEADPPSLVTLAGAAGTLREIAPERLDVLRERMARFDEATARLGVSPRSLGEPIGALTALRFLGRNVLAVTVGLAVALAGAIAWAVPYQLTGLLARLGPKERDVMATVKVLVGLFAYPLWFFLGLFLTDLYAGPVATLVLALVAPTAGLYAERYLSRRRRALRALKGTWLAVSQKHRLAVLRTERDELAAELEALASLLADEAPDASRVQAPDGDDDGQ